MRVKCLAQDHNTTTWPGLKHGPLDLYFSMLTTRPLPLPINNHNNSDLLSVVVTPSLSTRPSDQTVLEGSNATFHCAADGNPAPEINWIKDGKIVATGKMLTFEAARNQSGNYWCSAENGLNSTVNASANLDVQCK